MIKEVDHVIHWLRHHDHRLFGVDPEAVHLASVIIIIMIVITVAGVLPAVAILHSAIIREDLHA